MAPETPAPKDADLPVPASRGVTTGMLGQA